MNTSTTTMPKSSLGRPGPIVRPNTESEGASLVRDEGGRAEQVRRQGRETLPRAAGAPRDPDPESYLGRDTATPYDRTGRRRPQKVGVKADKIECDRRIDTIRRAILKGFSTQDIIRYVLTQTDWDIDKRQIFRYVRAARRSVQDSSRRNREEETAKAIERNEMILKATLSPPRGVPPDYRGALRANIANVRLMGLDAPLRHSHGADPEAPPLPDGGDFIILVQEVVE
jgi:hypothetical protein